MCIFRARVIGYSDYDFALTVALRMVYACNRYVEVE